MFIIEHWSLRTDQKQRKKKNKRKTNQKNEKKEETQSDNIPMFEYAWHSFDVCDSGLHGIISWIKEAKPRSYEFRMKLEKKKKKNW